MRLQTSITSTFTNMRTIHRDCPWDDTWQAFEQLGTQGKVGYVGPAELCGMGHRHRMPGGLQTWSGWSEQRTKYLPSQQPHGGTGGNPGCRYYGLGPSGAPWVEAFWAARRKLASGCCASDETLKEINEIY